MKLNKYQKARLLEHEWDVVEVEVNGETQNCKWLNIESEDGAIFGEVCEHFSLTGEEDCVKLLVIGTQEG
jgi:hypothetical protein